MINEKEVKKFNTGCIVCGSPLQYFDSAKRLKCEICQKEFDANCFCINGHYVCDKCHTQKAFQFITDYTYKTTSKNPIAIAESIMEDSSINMHGPEHHYLVVASLLSAYKNSGGEIDLKLCLEKGIQRAKNVAGGICGLWGSCGAGIASGIFISIITGATSLSIEEWSLANKMTGCSLLEISKYGGPRCCKRNTFLAINTAIDFILEHKGIQMQRQQDIRCKFFSLNKQCKKSSCVFWHNK